MRRVRAVVHLDPETPRQVVLEVWGFAAVGLGDRPQVVRPAEPGLEYETADLGIADLQDLRLAVRERPNLIRRSELAVLRLLPHGSSSYSRIPSDRCILTY
jgi:hypothetical protein